MLSEVPHHILMGDTPIQSWQGLPPWSWPGMGYPLFWTWGGGTPPPEPEMGYPLPGPEMGRRGYPSSWPGIGWRNDSRAPPPAVEMWTDTQSENITFPHPSHAGDNYVTRSIQSIFLRLNQITDFHPSGEKKSRKRYMFPIHSESQSSRWDENAMSE